MAGTAVGRSRVAPWPTSAGSWISLLLAAVIVAAGPLLANDAPLDAAAATGGGAAAAAFAPPYLAATSAADSLPTARTAIGWPTATLAPSGATITASVPSSNASVSITALSVSISAIFSPDRTASPARLCHLTTVPSDIVSDSWGMVISVGMGGGCWLVVVGC